MTTTDRVDLVIEADRIRDGLGEIGERFRRLMEEVRELPGGEHVWQRVDAYPGIRLDRDIGAGQGAADWVEEVRAFLAEEEDQPMPRDSAFLRSHGHDPRGPGADERQRARDIATAREMRAQGHSLHAIHLATGRSKEWLRTYAGITD